MATACSSAQEQYKLVGHILKMPRKHTPKKKKNIYATCTKTSTSQVAPCVKHTLKTVKQRTTFKYFYYLCKEFVIVMKNIHSFFEYPSSRLTLITYDVSGNT